MKTRGRAKWSSDFIYYYGIIKVVRGIGKVLRSITQAVLPVAEEVLPTIVETAGNTFKPGLSTVAKM